MENRLQRRPRSTSMKDRQNSKAQSDRTSSMESECSPDSRLIAQVQQHTDAAAQLLKVLGSSLEIKNKMNYLLHTRGGNTRMSPHVLQYIKMAHSTVQYI